MNNKKKVMIILGIIIVLVAVAVSLLLYSRYDNRTRKIGDELGISREKITRAYIMNGNSGEITEIEKNEIDGIYNNLESISIKAIKIPPYTGWGYRLTFECEDEVSEVTWNGFERCNINGTDFSVEKTAGNKLLQEVRKVNPKIN